MIDFICVFEANLCLRYNICLYSDMYYLNKTGLDQGDEEVNLFPVCDKTLVILQGGITEEQMLKFMGANTNLSPLQAKELVEVNVTSLISLLCLSHVSV